MEFKRASKSVSRPQAVASKLTDSMPDMAMMTRIPLDRRFNFPHKLVFLAFSSRTSLC
jgi:hypothetical protein